MLKKKKGFNKCGKLCLETISLFKKKKKTKQIETQTCLPTKNIHSNKK